MIQVLSVKFYLHFDFVNFMLSIYYEIQTSNKVPKFEHYNYWRSLVVSGTVFSWGSRYTRGGANDWKPSSSLCRISC